MEVLFNGLYKMAENLFLYSQNSYKKNEILMFWEFF